MRSVFLVVVMAPVTAVLATVVIVAGLLGVPNRPGGVYHRLPRVWSRLMLRVAGVRLVVHDAERMAGSKACVYAANHVSWYDIFTLLAILPRYRFVAKTELFRIPLFGRAARTAGTIPIERQNRSAALHAYDVAARELARGEPIVVCPEGTRGETYRLRPFKKGPFVLAIAAQVPVVPVVIHGTREVMPKGTFRFSPGTVHVRFLEAIPTSGLGYDDRDQLARECWSRMADTLRSAHGIESGPFPTDRERMPDVASSLPLDSPLSTVHPVE